MPVPSGSTCQCTTIEGFLCGKPAAYVISNQPQAGSFACGIHADMAQRSGGRIVEQGELDITILETDEPTPTGHNALTRLTAMAELLKRAKNRAAIIAAQLEKAEREVALIESEDMPLLMQELKLKNFELEDGTKLEVVEDLKCGITEANKAKAHAWVRKGGWGGIIKTQLTQLFGRGEEKLAEQVARDLRKQTKRDVLVKETIHSSTLKAFIKERRAAGVKVPEDLFNVYVSKKAIMTRKDEVNGSQTQDATEA
jgi:hypothetical protein